MKDPGLEERQWALAELLGLKRAQYDDEYSILYESRKELSWLFDFAWQMNSTIMIAIMRKCNPR